MDLLWVPFITGLTTGGLSCIAVQGGLVTGTLAGQIEKDLKRTKPKKRRRSPGWRFPSCFS